MEDSPIDRLYDLTDSASQRFYDHDLAEARRRIAEGTPEEVRAIRGSFALVARRGTDILLARSLDRPLRFMVVKRLDGPALVAAERIDQIAELVRKEGYGDQFHPSYTRMVPAHHVTTVRLIGCPDPAPVHTRFVAPERGTLPADPAAAGRRYVGALADETAAFLRWLEESHPGAPVGVLFSGGIDSGAVFLVILHTMRRLGISPARLKAFTLSAGNGEDLAQARRFLDALDLGFYLEPVEVEPESIDVRGAVRVVEDYKPLDLESAAALLALGRGIRERYPDWRFLADGDGGDENLKDYPLETGGELTIRSVLANPMLYQEGWGVGKLKHSDTYSGGYSRSCARNAAPLASLGFSGFSPFTAPALVEAAEAIPFPELTGGEKERLYALKGEIVAAGVRELTGMAMPAFPKRRFQHGAFAEEARAGRPAPSESELRGVFSALWA